MPSEAKLKKNLKKLESSHNSNAINHHTWAEIGTGVTPQNRFDRDHHGKAGKHEDFVDGKQGKVVIQSQDKSALNRLFSVRFLPLGR